MAVTGAGVPVALVLDGSQLPTGTACLRIEGPGTWVRGMALASCPVAIELVGDAVGTTLVGTNGDNVNDAYEELVFG